MTRTGNEQIRDGEIAWVAWPRGDLAVYGDSEGRVLRVERIGDDVRFRDLLDVIGALVMPDETGER